MGERKRERERGEKKERIKKEKKRPDQDLPGRRMAWTRHKDLQVCHYENQDSEERNATRCNNGPSVEDERESGFGKVGHSMNQDHK